MAGNYKWYRTISLAVLMMVFLIAQERLDNSSVLSGMGTSSMLSSSGSQCKSTVSSFLGIWAYRLGMVTAVVVPLVISDYIENIHNNHRCGRASKCGSSNKDTQMESL